MENQESIDDQDQYLTFEVCRELYAIGVLDLREIISFQSATRVPMACSSIRGLINLRGIAVPVVDLAVKFGENPTKASKRTCVVILDSSRSHERGAIGILADSVNEVVEIPRSEIESAPNFGVRAGSDYLLGLVRVADRFIPILDVERLLSEEEQVIAQEGRDWGGLEPRSTPTPAPASEDKGFAGELEAGENDALVEVSDSNSTGDDRSCP